MKRTQNKRNARRELTRFIETLKILIEITESKRGILAKSIKKLIKIYEG